MKRVLPALLLLLPTCQAAWQQSLMDWFGGIRESLLQVQEGERCVPLFRSEQEALEYVDALLPELRTRFRLRLHGGVGKEFVNRVANLCLYRGYCNNITCTMRQDELEITPVYTDWVVMRAVYLRRLGKRALDADARQAYERALNIVEQERTRLNAASSGKETQQDALALALHDRVCQLATYSLRDQQPATRATSRMLLKGRGVCEGYARTYGLLLTMAGIENRYIFGRSRGQMHAWNMVKLNGRWTHVDVTLDDAGRQDLPSRRYFAISDSQIARDHSWEHQHWPQAPMGEAGGPRGTQKRKTP